jgi:lipoprotein-anchoring transpeptidase ErfK/SrfK
VRRPALLLPALLALAGCGGSGPDPAPAPAAAPAFRSAGASAPPARPATRPRAPRGRHLIARLRRPVLLRESPGGRRLARLGTRTPFGTRTVLGVVARRPGWLQVVATERERGAPGWIPADGARLSGTDLALRVDRSARELTLVRGGRVLRRVPVAIGRASNPTPTGRFAVTDKLRPSDPASPYGCCIVALSGHQRRLAPGWPGGDRLAVHHTPQTSSIGRAASLGCLRGGRADLEYLMRRVPLGAPVFIRA